MTPEAQNPLTEPQPDQAGEENKPVAATDVVAAEPEPETMNMANPEPQRPQTAAEYVASLGSREAVELAMEDVRETIAFNERQNAEHRELLDRLIQRHDYFHRQS